ncbi:MAG: alpha/beta hydrolase [Methanomassiliicoccaceae archaeon]|nr:alpha/beta hydrolase [Methanomassiliicoccaceae archaeon]
MGGHSSGGNFATVTCMKAKERKDVEIKYQILVYPGTDAATDPYTRPKCKKGLSNKMIEMIVLSYVEDPEQTRSPYVSPVLATNDQLTGLPKALVILAGDGDPLTPEGRVYAENMRRAGVNVELHEFADTLHGFVHKRSPDAEKAMDLIIDFINNENAA